MKIGIATLGCDKNGVDSEYLAGVLADSGFEPVAVVDPPGPAGLRGVVVNTCGFVEDARRESVASVVAWGEHKLAMEKRGKRFRLVVMGCLAQRHSHELREALPEADAVLGLGQWREALEVLRGGDPMEFECCPAPQPVIATPHRRAPLGSAKPHAFLKIADGCSHRCAFCAIPAFKGPARSVPREILVAEARMLLASGARELVLVAQDTGAYGRDLYGAGYDLASLLADLASLRGDFWVRVLYTYPGGVTPRLLEAVAGLKKVVKYLDIPLQHLHPDVLARMRRPGPRAVEPLVARVRRAVPDVALRTTLIAGFPGETAAQHGFACEEVRRLRFDRMGAFAFSPEEGTAAAAMRPRVRRATAEARRGELMAIQAAVSRARNAGLVGTRTRVLIEARLDDGRWIGRTQADAPEVDGLVFVEPSDALNPGGFATVGVTGVVGDYDLSARV